MGQKAPWPGEGQREDHRGSGHARYFLYYSSVEGPGLIICGIGYGRI